MTWKRPPRTSSSAGAEPDSARSAFTPKPTPILWIVASFAQLSTGFWLRPASPLHNIHSLFPGSKNDFGPANRPEESTPPLGGEAFRRTRSPFSTGALPERSGLKPPAGRVAGLHAAHLERHHLVRPGERPGENVPGDGVEGAPVSLPRQEGPHAHRIREGEAR